MHDFIMTLTSSSEDSFVTISFNVFIFLKLWGTKSSWTSIEAFKLGMLSNPCEKRSFELIFGFY